MSTQKGERSGTGRVSPARDFAKYCTAEFERRRDSGEDFDERAYRASMEIALKRLEQLEETMLA